VWIRKDLKERAKAVLKNIYWKAFWISIVIALAGGSGGRSGGGGSGDNRHSIKSITSDITNSGIFPSMAFFVMVAIGIGLFFIALRIFLGYPLEVGGRKYFIQSAEYKDNQRCFSFAFDGSNYKGIVPTMLLRAVQNFLWYLLLIIPGIVKSYAYRMVPYILADNPDIGAKKAIKLSNEMTEGHKFDIFVLDLSFIGWYLLGVLALFVGVLFVMPYENATNAELYLVLRKNALENNFCSYEDLLLNGIIQGENDNLDGIPINLNKLLNL